MSLLFHFPRWDIDIVATDLSSRALRHAPPRGPSTEPARSPSDT
jgi:hypothetical protein